MATTTNQKYMVLNEKITEVVLLFAIILLIPFAHLIPQTMEHISVFSADTHSRLLVLSAVSPSLSHSMTFTASFLAMLHEHTLHVGLGMSPPKMLLP